MLLSNRFPDTTIAIASQLEALPHNVIEEIALNLSYYEVCRFMRTCYRVFSILRSNAFWYRYIKRHPIKTPVHLISDYRRAYHEYVHGVYISMKSESQGPNYVCRVENGKTVHLTSCGMLSVRGSMRVAHGNYDVSWHLKLEEPVLLPGLIFKIDCETDKKAHEFVCINETQLQDMAKRLKSQWIDWSRMYIGQIRAQGKVNISLSSVSDGLKAGIHLRSVHLDLIPDVVVRRN